VISRKSDNPWVSFLGYNLVVVPIGIVLSVCLQGQSVVSITYALATTAGVVAIMLIASTMFPNIFLSLGRILGLTLFAIIIVELLLAIFGVATPTFLDVIVAGLFCLYIGYDWAKAQSEDPTPDAAVDACVGLYLDIVNLFLRILSLYSRRRD
jgi:FtsH-binding integral membrane protein